MESFQYPVCSDQVFSFSSCGFCAFAFLASFTRFRLSAYLFGFWEGLDNTVGDMSIPFMKVLQCDLILL